MMINLLSYAIIFVVSVYLVRLMFAPKTVRIKLPPSPISLPFIGHLHLLDVVPYKSFHKLTTRYGPLIHLRLGSVPCIVASSPELAKELLSTNEISFASRPISTAVHHVTYNSSGFAFAPHGPHWKFMRNLCMSHLLGGRSLAQSHPIRTDELLQLVQFLVQKSIVSEAVDLSHELIKLSNNIICRMLLSIRYSGKQDQAAEAQFLARELTEIFGYINISDCVWFLRSFDLQGLFKKSRDTQRRCDTLVEGIIREREQVRRKENKKVGGTDSGVGPRDFLDILLDVYESDTAEIKLTRDHIKAFILDIFVAGSETSAAGTEWALSELINHPTIFKKAREEIDTVIGKNTRLVEESDLQHLPYLQAIFKESLRLHPPIPTISRESHQDCQIAGFDIPAKTKLFLNVWSINRDPKYWDHPLEFRPERFMPDYDHQSNLIDVKGQHVNLLPFGTGRRGCPGLWLVLQQVPTLLAALIQCFDWKIPQHDDGTEFGTVDMIERPGLTIPRATPLALVPVTRFDPFTTSVASN